MKLKKFNIWVIYHCYCFGEIDTYEIHLNKNNAEKRLKELIKELNDYDEYWIRKTTAYK
jgi:hypothetical protein